MKIVNKIFKTYVTVALASAFIGGHRLEAGNFANRSLQSITTKFSPLMQKSKTFLVNKAGFVANGFNKFKTVIGNNKKKSALVVASVLGLGILSLIKKMDFSSEIQAGMNLDHNQIKPTQKEGNSEENFLININEQLFSLENSFNLRKNQTNKKNQDKNNQQFSKPTKKDYLDMMKWMATTFKNKKKVVDITNQANINNK